MNPRTMLVWIVMSFLVCVTVVYASHDRSHTEFVDRVTLVDNVTYVQEVFSVKEIHAPKLDVFGTEYQYNDTVKIFVQLVDQETGSGIDNATCFVDIWAPNSTRIVDGQLMNQLEEGIYFHDKILTESLDVGVYPINVECNFNIDNNLIGPEELAVREGVQTGFIGNVYVIDGQTLSIAESIGGARRLDFNISFLNTSIGINTQLIGLDLFIARIQQGGDPVIDPIQLFIFNYTSQNFINVSVPGFSGYTQGFERFLRVLLSNNGTNFSDIVSNGTLIMRVNDTIGGAGDNQDTPLNIDFLQLLVVNNIVNESITNIRGGGEIHLRNTTRVAVALDDTPINISFDVFLLILLLILLISLGFVESDIYFVIVGFSFGISGLFFLTTANSWWGWILVALGGIFALKGIFSAYSE